MIICLHFIIFLYFLDEIYQKDIGGGGIVVPQAGCGMPKICKNIARISGYRPRFIAIFLQFFGIPQPYLKVEPCIFR